MHQFCKLDKQVSYGTRCFEFCDRLTHLDNFAFIERRLELPGFLFIICSRAILGGVITVASLIGGMHISSRLKIIGDFLDRLL